MFWHPTNVRNEEDQGLVWYKHTARGFPFLRSLPRGVSLETRKQGGSRTKSQGYYTTHLPQCIYKHSETDERQESGLFPSLCITSRYSRFLSPLNPPETRSEQTPHQTDVTRSHEFYFHEFYFEKPRVDHAGELTQQFWSHSDNRD